MLGMITANDINFLLISRTLTYIERWTNNKYTSTLHRVTSPVSNEYRYSVAFFNEGLLDQMIECIPTCLESGQKALYEPVKVEEHLRERYGSSYIKVGIIA